MLLKTLGILSILFGLWLAFFPIDYSTECKNYSLESYEKFNSDIKQLNTISKIQSYIDSIYTANNSNFDSFQYFQTTKEIVKQKFYHGNASYSLQENWIAFLFGKYIWSHINSLVSPNEVIKHCSAMCSQQTMVFTKLMALRGYSYRYVYLKNINGNVGHFCCEIWLGNEWHFVDVNQEPNLNNIKGEPNQNIENLRAKNKLEAIYKNSANFMHDLDSKNVVISYSPINEKLGFKMILFQFVTKWLSFILPIIIGLILIWRSKK